MQAEIVLAKLAVALRSARSALGWSQEELATRMGMAKTTIARLETMEGGIRAEQLTQMLQLYHAHGVKLDFVSDDNITLTLEPAAVEHAMARLRDEAFRRSDRKRGKGLIQAAMESDDSENI